MTDTFLNSMFQIVYEGLHNGEYNRAKTVMLAYDDAIHGITGKAGENRIFELDFNEKLFTPQGVQQVIMIQKKINGSVVIEIFRDLRPGDSFKFHLVNFDAKGNEFRLFFI